MHGGGWHSYIKSGDEKPKFTWALFKRVIQYAHAYRWHLIGMLVLILISSGLSLITPLIVRNLIDVTIPSKDVHKLVILSIGLLIIPILKGAESVLQRRLNTSVGEGVIFDLRCALYEKLQRMSLRFFYPHPHRRINEPLEQRRGGGAECHQQHHCQYGDGCDPGSSGDQHDGKY